MGAPGSEIEAADQPSAEALLGAFKTISPSERRRHASVLNYWLSIRGDKEFPPLHDLDPLELSDAGATSILLELISGGHDAEVRHLGEALRDETKVERIIDAAHPSLLATIGQKLPIVAISRDFLAFEDQYEGENGNTRCWVTLLPLSAGGAWVDYVYAMVSLECDEAKSAKKKAETKKAKEKAEEPEAVVDAVDEIAAEPEVAPVIEEPAAVEETPVVEEPVAEEVAFEAAVTEPEPEEAVAPVAEEVAEPVVEGAIEEPVAQADEPAAELEPIPEFLQAPHDMDADAPSKRPGFSKLFDNLVGLTGFYGHGYKVDGEEAEPDQADPAPEPTLADVPADEPPAVEEVIDEPVAEEPVEVHDEPAPEELAAEEPAVAEPEAAPAAVDEPVTGDSVVIFEQPVDEPVAEEPAAELADELPASEPEPALASASAPEGTLENKLTDVRAKADEAQQAKLRATAALYEGLSAAYDFALDAEEAPEEYLKLVEAQGLKIQLRSPMKPVVKLAFSATCDDSTIKQLEAVLSWALDNELPRGSLLERIEAAGGIGPILAGEAKAA
jgi:hypothetical protein